MKTVLISAGHNMVDPGIVANGRKEADIAVKTRDALAAELRKRGLTVREDENLASKNLKLPDAIKLIAGTDLAIELHCNGGGGTGTETVYADNARGRAQIPRAIRLTKAVTTPTGLKVRVYIASQPGAKPDTATPHKSLGFCRAGGLIVELFFLDSAADLKKFDDSFDKVIISLADEIEK